jgi:hypothetical protein
VVTTWKSAEIPSPVTVTETVSATPTESAAPEETGSKHKTIWEWITEQAETMTIWVETFVNDHVKGKNGKGENGAAEAEDVTNRA